MPDFTNDSLKLHFEDQGKGQPLMIIPGNTASSICHSEEVEYFSRNFRVIAIDPRGTGRSDRMPEWSLSWWDDVCGDIQALLDHLNIDNCIIMGTSGGAGLALLCAIKFPQRIKAVVADSIVEFFEPGDLRYEVEMRAKGLPEMLQFWQFAQGEDWEAVVKADSRMLLGFADAGGDLFTGRLAEIQCPVLLTGSTTDSFMPGMDRQFQSMTRQIPDSQFVIANQGDHPFMWTRASLFRSICDEFLGTLGADAV